MVVLNTVPVFHILGVICTLLFVYFDNVFTCCCDCWRGEQEIVLYDPDNREANLVWKDGQVIDMEQMEKEEYVETGEDIELCEMESQSKDYLERIHYYYYLERFSPSMVTRTPVPKIRPWLKSVFLPVRPWDTINE